MTSTGPLRPDRENPEALHERAIDNIRFIRSTMESAGRFTAVPGVGQVVIGVTALVATWLAARRTTPEGWIGVWLVEGAVAALIGATAIALKSRAEEIPLGSGPNRRFALGFTPPLVAGAFMTLALYQQGVADRLPGTWLLLFGSAVVTGGALSIRIVPIMGASFMLLGCLALFGPLAWGNAFMAMGFGGLMIVYGAIIAWRHGG